MEHRQVDGIDAYNFPPDLNGTPLLAWMGDDYVQYVATKLLAQFRKQDPGTHMLAVKCEARPEFHTRVHEKSGTVLGVSVRILLQLLLKDSDAECWRLRGNGDFTASGLDRPGEESATVAFNIESTEAVEPAE